MAITESKKQSDLEKRLKILRQQVYGKREFRVESSELRIKNKVTMNSELKTTNYSDLTYLRYDLGKILVFSTFALGVQLILFILTKNHILNLKFF